MFALKLLLTPLLIAAASLVQRRLGGEAGGVLAGLPLTSGPVSLFLALQYGGGFAARSAVASLLGTVAMSVFCAAYARSAQRAAWAFSLPLAAVVYVGAAGLASQMPQSLATAAAWSFPLLVAMVLVIGRSNRHAVGLQPPRWDLPARMAVAALAVLVITGLGDIVGARWSGLLATIPVFAAVMGVFSHRHGGFEAARSVLRGIAIGALGAAAFFVVVAAAIERYGVTLAYIGAVCAALATTALARRLFKGPSSGDLLGLEPGL